MNEPNRDRYGRVSASVMANAALTMQARMLYALLACYADPDGLCYPSIDRLVEESGICRSQVIAYLNELAMTGVVTREGYRRRVRTYRLGTSPAQRTSPVDQTSPTEPTSPAQRTGKQPTSPASQTSTSPAQQTLTVPVEQKKQRGGERAREEIDPFNPANGWPQRAEVIELAKAHGADDETAESLFASFTAAGWKNKHGVAYEHWGYAIENAIRYRRANTKANSNATGRSDHPKPSGRRESGTELYERAKQARERRLHANGTGRSTGSDTDDGDVAGRTAVEPDGGRRAPDR